MLMIVNKRTHEKLSSQPLQTNNKKFKIAVTFLTGFIGIFDVTNSDNNFYFMKSFTDEDGFIQITIPPGAYEIESLNKEIKRIIIDEDQFTEANYPFRIKPNSSALGSNIAISPQGPITSFMFNDSFRDLLGFHAIKVYEEKNLSPNLVGILSFDNIFLETVVAQGMIFKGKRSGIIHKFTMDVDPGKNTFKNLEEMYNGM